MRRPNTDSFILKKVHVFMFFVALVLLATLALVVFFPRIEESVAPSLGSATGWDGERFFQVVSALWCVAVLCGLLLWAHLFFEGEI